MLTVGLVVEGIYDEAALKELIQKCAPSGTQVISRPCGSREKLMRMFPGILEDFRHAKNGSHVDKAIVIRDADNKNAAELIKRMEAKVFNRNYPFHKNLLVAVQQLEAWLLADESAISAVTGKKITRVQNPENLRDPKERLNRLLSEAKSSYTPEVARKIAASAKLETIEFRCPSFKKFREAVVDC